MDNPFGGFERLAELVAEFQQVEGDPDGYLAWHEGLSEGDRATFDWWWDVQMAMAQFVAVMQEAVRAVMAAVEELGRALAGFVETWVTGMRRGILYARVARWAPGWVAALVARVWPRWWLPLWHRMMQDV